MKDKLLKYSMLNTINRNFISAASMYVPQITAGLDDCGMIVRYLYQVC